MARFFLILPKPKNRTRQSRSLPLHTHTHTHLSPPATIHLLRKILSQHVLAVLTDQIGQLHPTQPFLCHLPTPHSPKAASTTSSTIQRNDRPTETSTASNCIRMPTTCPPGVPHQLGRQDRGQGARGVGQARVQHGPGHLRGPTVRGDDGRLPRRSRSGRQNLFGKAWVVYLDLGTFGGRIRSGRVVESQTFL